MVSLNKRTVKGAPLTHSELDANFQALADAIAAIPAGEQGPAGDDGADGASAYQIAVDNGFVGTEAAWLASLVGPAGADGTSYDPTEFGALQTEIETARGDRSNLNNRITTISNFASPNAGGVVVGGYYDNAFQGTNSSTATGTANRVEMAPYYTSMRLRIDQLGIAVSTAVASSAFRCFIYGSDGDGWPDELLYEGADDLSGATTGYKSHTLDFTFDSGRQYWLGVRCSSTASYRAINASSAVNLGVNGSNGTNYFTAIRRTITFTTALPANWSFVSSDLTAGASPPSIRMRAAALP